MGSRGKLSITHIYTNCYGIVRYQLENINIALGSGKIEFPYPAFRVSPGFLVDNDTDKSPLNHFPFTLVLETVLHAGG